VIEFETGVAIERPAEEVFAYLSDPTHFPAWNSAVRAVQLTSAGGGGVGAIYRMERDLPTGKVENDLQVVAVDPPREFVIRTMSGPTPFHYRYRLSEEDGGTRVVLDAEVDLSGPAALVASLARRAVKKGVDDNLRTLKTLLEAR
jgi:uncharacterized protein YndB with AHSA1/START domain